MARRKGLSHNEVAHRWSNDPQGEDYGEGHHMYFGGGVIYSYGRHFPIARHVTNDRGEPAILLTTRSYSISTSKHQSITWRACHHLNVFHVPFVEGTLEKLAANVKSFQADYDAAIGKAARCSTQGSGPQWDLDHAEQIRKDGNDYAVFFGIDDCVVPAFKLHVAEIWSRWARLNSPEAVALREAAAERRAVAARKAQAVALERWANGEEGYQHAYGLAQLATEEQKARRAAIVAERNKEKLAAWLAGDTTVRFGYGNDVPCLLRLSSPSDGKYEPYEVQTTWGARFPVADAKLAFRIVQRVIASGKRWEQNGEQVKLGNYRIDHITPEGNVRAGCHLVLWPAIEKVARDLGLI